MFTSENDSIVHLPPFIRKEDDPSHKLSGKGLKVRKVLAQALEGGVFVVSDKANNTFVLKEARFGINTIDGQDQRNRLTHEYTILQKIAHLKIVSQPEDIFDVDNNSYLLMEYLPGQTLRQYMQQRYESTNHAQEPLEQICESLLDIVRQCHVEGLALCDLTPDSFIVQADECKLINLEAAHYFTSEEHPFIGYTPEYMAPGTELQASHAFAYDFYALSAILFFMLTGLDLSFETSEAILSSLPELINDEVFLRTDAPEDIVTAILALLREAQSLLPTVLADDL